ncbi:MAG: hypothetical protein CMH83_23685 [Nocardioides sp.]|nr:hypothetical protein [Nocardioides sp.]
MPRRVSLPQADDLFRPTHDGEPPARRSAAVRAVPDTAATEPAPTTEAGGRRAASGRVKHDEKMTVYVTSEELLALEHARLSLRAGHSLGVDRGRLVREAVSLVLHDLEENGEDSMLVRRLREDRP